MEKVSLLKAVYRTLMRRRAVGRNVSFQADLRVGRGCFLNASRSLTVGREVAIGTNTWISCNGVIGDGVLIASQVGIVTRGEHAIDRPGVPVSKAPRLGDPGWRSAGPEDDVHIDDDVWIGFNAIILSGIRIGRGAIIAAGAVVTRDVEPYAIMAGTPAKKVGERMTQEQRAEHERLLALRWSTQA